MNVLGITDGITCGAAIVSDGKILSAVNEERLTRIKMAFGFPRRSISEVMRLAGITSIEIDLVMVATLNNYFFNGIRPFDGWFHEDKGFFRNAVFATAGRLSSLIDTIPGVEYLYYKSRWPIFRSRRKAIQRILQAEFNISASVEFVNHHLAHSASAYFTSGFKDALVVSMDGGGDGASSHVYEVRDGIFNQVGYTSAYNSLGNYYAYVTHLCGYKAEKHEGKITGLAAHGKPQYLDQLDSFIRVNDGNIKNVGRCVFLGAVKKLKSQLPANWRKEDLAASIQRHAEDLVVSYVKRFLNSDKPVKIAIAGGVFANVCINQRIYEIDGIEEIFIHPGMTDGGLAVGAALTSCMKNRESSIMPRDQVVLQDVYLGAKYSSNEIEEALRSSGVSYTKPESVGKEVAKLLAQGYVVARFDGRMEYGPRALGNRSILYHPADPTVNDWLNKQLKRTEFMPFAPVTLMEYADDCYQNCKGALQTAKFMTITFDCTELMKNTCPGVVHLDGTARPQLITREDNPTYYDIIQEFRELTEVPTIINTSFNMHEEPIVCSPADAIRAFQLGNLDYLSIGDFLVRTQKKIEHSLIPMPIVV